MAKDKRGGRSLRKNPYNEYETIGTANNGSIKVIKPRPGTSNTGVPLFSNSKNTTYFVAKEVDGVTKVKSIAVYRNRQLIQNIDIDPKKGNHYHKWQAEDVRGKSKIVRDKKHFYNLSAAQQKLLNMAVNWNNGGK